MEAVLTFLNRPIRSHSLLRLKALLLVFAVAALIAGLLILKSLSVVRFWENPWLYVYSILLFAFQMSRLASALMYDARHHTRPTLLRHFVSVYEPTATFIIPCKNEEAEIYRTISRCYGVDYPKHKIEVIIVNDGSTDGTMDEITRAKADFTKLKVIDWKVNRGKRHAMAAAVRMATGDIVIQLDSDSYIKPEDFRKLVLPFRNDGIAAVCAHADPANKDTNLLTRAQTGYYFMAFRVLKAAESTFSFVLCCSGCCSAYRKSDILPLMDEFEDERFLGVNVSFGDDRSLTNLILREGKRTIYLEDVQAYTIVPETFRQLIRQQVRWKKSWTINTVKASRYVLGRDKFVALTYFFPLALVTVITPWMAIYGLVYAPVMHREFPYYFLAGSLLVTMLFAMVSVMIARNNRHWYYLGLWGLVNTFVLSLLLPYALLTIRNNKWGTR